MSHKSQITVFISMAIGLSLLACETEKAKKPQPGENVNNPGGQPVGDPVDNEYSDVTIETTINDEKNQLETPVNNISELSMGFKESNADLNCGEAGNVSEYSAHIKLDIKRVLFSGCGSDVSVEFSETFEEYIKNHSIYTKLEAGEACEVNENDVGLLEMTYINNQETKAFTNQDNCSEGSVCSNTFSCHITEIYELREKVFELYSETKLEAK